MVDGGWQYGTSGYNSVSNYAGYANIVPGLRLFPRCPPYGRHVFVVLVVMPEHGSSTDRAAVGFSS